jgi:hypothetical protein
MLREYPEELKYLFMGNCRESKNFLANIRQFNSALAFASLNVQIDHSVTKKGPFAFRVHGQLYHQTSQFITASKNPRYSEIYFLDSDLALKEQMKILENNKCSKKVKYI